MSFYQSVIERRLQPELMDEPGLDARRHRQALRGLSRINFWSRSAPSLWQPIRDLQREKCSPIRVLDIACGGGDVTLRLARKAKRTGLPIEFVGCDKSTTAVGHAQFNACGEGLAIEYFVADVLVDNLLDGFDVVMCSLFLHHLAETQTVSMLRKMADAASSLVLVNDLRRSQAGLLLAQAGTRMLSLSPVVHYDGLRSVEGAYTCEEIECMAARAGLAEARITKTWPQRFLLTWRRDDPTE